MRYKPSNLFPREAAALFVSGLLRGHVIPAFAEWELGLRWTLNQNANNISNPNAMNSILSFHVFQTVGPLSLKVSVPYSQSSNTTNLTVLMNSNLRRSDRVACTLGGRAPIAFNIQKPISDNFERPTTPQSFTGN